MVPAATRPAICAMSVNTGANTIGRRTNSGEVDHARIGGSDDDHLGRRSVANRSKPRSRSARRLANAVRDDRDADPRS
jgi:hypothetical protein